jgi:hypothetical protein
MFLPVRKADNLPPSVSRLSTKSGIINISHPYTLPRPVTGITILFFSFNLHNVSFHQTKGKRYYKEATEIIMVHIEVRTRFARNFVYSYTNARV